MPSISSLFYSSDPEKQTLHKRIVPSAEQRAMQQERWHDLEEYLAEDLQEITGYPISYWIQGSYKFGTQIRPARPEEEFDIDLGIYFNWEGDAEDGSYGPKEIKSLVQASVIKYATEIGEEVLEVVSPPKTRCSRVRFTGDFHIDIPSYHLDSSRDARSLATENDEWEDSDPKALYVWFREQSADDDDNLIRRLIRYIKMWAALQFGEEGRPSTIVLTVLVTEAFASLTEDQKNEDDIALKSVLEHIIVRLDSNSEVPNPVNTDEDLNRLSEEEFNAFFDKLKNLWNIADRALRSNSELEAALIWQEAFSHFFFIPLPIEETPSQRALVRVQFDPQVSVDAISSATPQKRFFGKNKIGPIPQGCGLTFTLDNYGSLPAGARVEWMVRNEGKDAEFNNDLGHIAGFGPQGHEHSAYVGTHYMDIIVRSVYNEIIGYKRIPVEIVGQATANKNKKRAWNGKPSKRQKDSNFLKRFS